MRKTGKGTSYKLEQWFPVCRILLIKVKINLKSHKIIKAKKERKTTC